MNKIYRNKDAATDVLSFETKEWAGAVFCIGEIYIAPSVAARNFLKYRHFWEKDGWIADAHKSKRNRGKNYKDNKDYKEGAGKELALLLIHGILHLFGYVHDEKHELDQGDPLYDKAMRDMQKFLYKRPVKIL